MEDVNINLFSQYKEIYKNIIINDINITNNNESESMKKIKKSLEKTYLVIKKYLSKLNKNNTKDEWIYCDSNCKIIRKLFKIEMNSTIYILNCIANSLITVDDSKVYFEIDERNINSLDGLWSNDRNYIYLKKMNIIIDENTGTEIEHDNKRLIMGFGPSCSGKTYCATKVINILSIVIPNYPKSFLSIDCDIYCKCSFIYQYILLVISKLKFKGLKNLVLSESFLFRTSLFDSNIIKNHIFEYLKILKSLNIKFSLYVPETLDDCEKDCFSSYKKYIELTGDKDWTCLVIFQHLNNESCPFKYSNPVYQCKGCIKTGKEIEKLVEKEYSMDEKKWEQSTNNSFKQFEKTDGIKLLIHNSDGYTYLTKETQERITTKSFILDKTKSSTISNNIGFIVNNSNLSDTIFQNFYY
jgi:hypothetical protein